MGKCLSCYQDTNESNQSDQQSKARDSNLKFEHQLRGEGSVVIGSGHSDHQHHHHQSGSRGSGVGGTSGGSVGMSLSSMNSSSNEKRSFYPRIPPILSSVSSENKRTSQQHRDYSESKILSLFEHYKDPNEEVILSDGIERLCQDLEVKPEEFKVLLLAWKFNASTMCKFSKQEFVGGCKSLKVASIKGIQSRFTDMLQEIQQDSEKFKDLYRFTFRFGLDADLGQRILPTDMAICLWKLVFSTSEPPLLERWLSFLEKNPNVRGIPRDTWNMFLNFLDSVGDDLSSYDDAEAWPSLFDDFVEYENDQTNQNVQTKLDTNGS
ncbi:hypothetical protein CHUAL_007965 [Chamberlinius hualienensis]